MLVNSGSAQSLQVGLTLNGWFPGTTTPSLPLSVNHLSDGVVILAAAAAFRQLRPSRTVVIGSDIHLVRSLREIGWANDAHRPALEHVGIDHGGIEIGVPQKFLNGSDILSSLQQMGCE